MRGHVTSVPGAWSGRRPRLRGARETTPLTTPARRRELHLRQPVRPTAAMAREAASGCGRVA